MNLRVFSILSFFGLFHTPHAMEESHLSSPSTEITKDLKNHGLQLKLIQPPSLEDCCFICENLHLTNLNKIGNYDTATLKSPFSNKPVGEIYQYSLELVNIDIFETLLGTGESKEAVQRTRDLLNSLLKTAHEQGVNRVFTSCSSESKLGQFFVTGGFQFCAEFPNLKKNFNTICFYKNIDANELPIKAPIEIIIQDEAETQEDSAATIQMDEFQDELTKIPGLFGVFLYDNTNIKGGVWGEIFSPENDHDQGIPHSLIYCVWVKNSLNGKGLGKILMEEAENFALSRGAKYIRLDTNGFQAPGFYQKLGFSLTRIRPNDFRVKGIPSSLYLCTKKLFENPLQDQGLEPYFNTLFAAHFFLRPLFPEDYVAFLPIFTDPEQMKYFRYGKAITAEKTKEDMTIEAKENNKIQPTYLTWSIITHQGIAGYILLTIPDDNDPEQELGYFVCPAFNGRGLATEASRLAMSSVEGPFMATAHPKNIVSAIVLTKLGFRADVTRMGVPKFGSLRDYYLLQDATPDRSASLGEVLRGLMQGYR